MRLAAVVLAALTPTLIVGCGENQAMRAKDPLTRKEVEAELASLPMPAEEFFSRLRSKQDYYPDWRNTWKEDLLTSKRDLDLAIEGAKRVDMLLLARGVGEKDVRGIASASSWNKWDGGSDAEVNVTARWKILLDHEHNVIGYVPYILSDDEE